MFEAQLCGEKKASHVFMRVSYFESHPRDTERESFYIGASCPTDLVRAYTKRSEKKRSVIHTRIHNRAPT